MLCDATRAVEWKRRLDHRRNSPHRSLGHFDARPLQVLLQAHIELVQPAQLQIGHALLLLLDIAAGADLVARHFEGWLSNVAPRQNITSMLKDRESTPMRRSVEDGRSSDRWQASLLRSHGWRGWEMKLFGMAACGTDHAGGWHAREAVVVAVIEVTMESFASDCG
jgi:hypothetical protein